MFCSDPPHRFGDYFLAMARGTWGGGSGAPDSLADRFNLLVAWVCRLMGQGGPSPGANPGRDPALAARIPVVWKYLSRLARRFIALAMQAQAGTLRRPPPRRAASTPAAATDPADPAATPRPHSLLPRGRGWLRRLVPGLAPAAGGLHALLQDPEMVALVAMGPQAGRLLRPLCRAMDLPLPDYLRLPPRPRKPRPPDPARQAARAALRAEAAWGRAFRRSLGLPARPPTLAAPASGPEPPATPAQARPPPKPA